MTVIRVTYCLTLFTMAAVASVWPRDSTTAQALMAPATVDPHFNNAGELATAIAAPDASDRPNPLWAVPLASLTETRERPIFSPTRRPPPVNNTVAIPVVVPPDRLTLSLVGAVAGENGIAIFRDDSTKAVVRLRIGQSHSGWSLERVTQHDATLRKNGEIATFALPTPSAK